jgi:hypothetical protein
MRMLLPVYVPSESLRIAHIWTPIRQLVRTFSTHTLLCFSMLHQPIEGKLAPQETKEDAERMRQEGERKAAAGAFPTLAHSAICTDKLQLMKSPFDRWDEMKDAG